MLNNWLKPNKPEQSLSGMNMNLQSFLEGTPLQDLKNNSTLLFGVESERYIQIKESLGHFYTHFDPDTFFDGGFLIKEDTEYNVQLYLDLYQGGVTNLTVDRDFVWFAGLVRALNTHLKGQKTICISNKIHFSEYGIQCDFLGFQRHLVSPDHLTRLHDYSINSMSLGKIRAETELLEPVLRDAHHVFFDISAIRKSDAPGSFNSLPTGFTCEEACQLMKYLGTSTNLQRLVIGGDWEKDDTTADCIAEIIWYFMEGKTQLMNDHPNTDQNFQEYVVEVESLNSTFSFVKNARSGRWWFKGDEKSIYISCSNNEYVQASNNNIPDRLLKHFTQI